VKRSDRPQGSGRWWRSQRGKGWLGPAIVAVLVVATAAGIQNHPLPSTTGPAAANAQAQPVQAQPAPPAPAPPQLSAGLTRDQQSWLATAGIAQGDWGYANYIITNESGWSVTIWNRQGSGAYGLCQALPADKMGSAGSDWKTNPITQLRWCNQYVRDRYHSWAAAKAWWDRTDCRAPPGASRCYSGHWW